MSGQAQHRIHRSLWRPQLLAGADPGFVVLEATLVAALLLGIGPSPITVGLAAFWMTAAHGFMSWACRLDPQIVAVFSRSLRYGSFYLSAPGLFPRSRGPRPSLPG
jgi:type IV secretory pathway TrbD component